MKTLVSMLVKTRVWAIIIVIVMGFGFSSFQEERPQAEIVINTQEKGVPVAESMFGIFFEEINNAGDGGLYPELVRNRGFEDKNIPEGYSVREGSLYAPAVVNQLARRVRDRAYVWPRADVPAWSLTDSSRIAMTVSDIDPLFPETANYLKLSITDASTPVAVINSGFWGMNVKKGERYLLRFYARAGQDYKGGITVKLVAAHGEVLASASFKSAKEWTEYKDVLTPSTTDSKAKLWLEFDETGTVSLDYVSLFPEQTFRNRPNGVRNDLAEFLLGLQPKFIRWPGGCVVEGITLNNRLEWKKMLGDPARRPGEYVTWGYRTSYGFGYHEYLQFCEDVGAAALYVCNVGMACQNRTGEYCSDEEVEEYLNDALDAIEYAIGDVSSEWGAKRAEAGHPEPFPLMYVEIGNENFGDIYDHRLGIFYRAIKEKYPQLLLIANQGMDGRDRALGKADFISPHYYRNADFFFNNFNHFDEHPRGDYFIYVGEYSCNSGVGGGNMLAALSEAVFLAGMERNGDLVTMCSYAPLLENRNNRVWSVNLIWFDTDSIVGRSSYYVQKMYAENKPSFTLNTELTVFSESASDSSSVANRNFAVAGYDEASREIIIKVINAKEEPFVSRIRLDQAAGIAKTGRVITLSADNLLDENSFAEPQKIIPQETAYHQFDQSFTYTFRPNSLTIFRIKTE